MDGITDCICGHQAGEHSFMDDAECMVLGCNCDHYMTVAEAEATGQNTVQLSPEQAAVFGIHTPGGRLPEPEQSTASSEPEEQVQPAPPQTDRPETEEERNTRLLKNAEKYGLEVPQPPVIAPTWWTALPFRRWIRKLVGLDVDTQYGAYMENLLMNNAKAQQMIIIRLRTDINNVGSYASNEIGVRLNELIAEVNELQKRLTYYEQDCASLQYSKVRYANLRAKEQAAIAATPPPSQSSIVTTEEEAKAQLKSQHNDGILKLET